jgi:hypothetical protein
MENVISDGGCVLAVRVTRIVVLCGPSVFAAENPGTSPVSNALGVDISLPLPGENILWLHYM